jgi:hypothetical protein
MPYVETGAVCRHCGGLMDRDGRGTVLRARAHNLGDCVVRLTWLLEQHETRLSQLGTDVEYLEEQLNELRAEVRR